jgi:hypothetical protein
MSLHANVKAHPLCNSTMIMMVWIAQIMIKNGHRNTQTLIRMYDRCHWMSALEWEHGQASTSSECNSECLRAPFRFKLWGCVNNYFTNSSISGIWCFSTPRISIIHAPAMRVLHSLASWSYSNFWKLTHQVRMYRYKWAYQGVNKFIKNLWNAANERSGQYDAKLWKCWMHIVIWNRQVLMNTGCPKHKIEQVTEVKWVMWAMDVKLY